MADKHKSKYKKPENKKPTYRKDLKDYTLDDKEGGLNPKTTGDKQLNVLRKTDKVVQDDGKMFPKYNADDRLYKDLEDGEYDPKTAAKRLKKRQDAEEKDVKDVLKDKIENLTREQKERLVREYIRRKIVKVLHEQTDTEAEPVDTETPEAVPTDAAATDTPPATDAAAPIDATTPAPADTAAPAPPPADTAPAATDAAPAPEMDDAEQTTLAVTKFSDFLKSEAGNVGRIKAIARALNSTFTEAETEDIKNFYNMLRVLSLKKLAAVSTKTSDSE
jgi:hypothetical protein